MKIEDLIKGNQRMKCDYYSCSHRGEELEMCYFDVYPLCKYYKGGKDELRTRDKKSERGD